MPKSGTVTSVSRQSVTHKTNCRIVCDSLGDIYLLRTNCAMVMEAGFHEDEPVGLEPAAIQNMSWALTNHGILTSC